MFTLEMIRNKIREKAWDQQYRFHLLDLLEPLETLGFRRQLGYTSAWVWDDRNLTGDGQREIL